MTTDQDITPTHKPYNRNYDRKKVEALNKIGVKPSDIAKMEDVAISTITRYLKSIGQQTANIQHYKLNKADFLCLSQAKSSTIADTIKDIWIDNPDRLKTLDDRLLIGIHDSVQKAKSFDHTAERLERDKSTHNIASVHADIAALVDADKAQEIQDTEGDG